MVVIVGKNSLVNAERHSLSLSFCLRSGNLTLGWLKTRARAMRT